MANLGNQDCAPARTLAKHPFPSALEHSAQSLPSGFTSETRRREKEHRLESTSEVAICNSEKGTVCVIEGSLSDVRAQLCCLHMKARSTQQGLSSGGDTTCCMWGTQTKPTFHNCKTPHPQTTALETADITQSNWDMAKSQYHQKSLLQLRHQSHSQVFKA